jgi:hypothetical protein
MITAIHTAVKGRVRYKVTELYGSVPLKRLLEVRLAEHAEIQEVSASTLTGNILVRFRPDLSPAAVASLLADIMTDYEDTVRRPPRKTRSWSIALPSMHSGGAAASTTPSCQRRNPRRS